MSRSRSNSESSVVNHSGSESTEYTGFERIVAGNEAAKAKSAAKLSDSSEASNAASHISENEESEKEVVLSHQNKIDIIFKALRAPLGIYVGKRFDQNSKEYKGIQFFHAGYSKTEKGNALNAIHSLLDSNYQVKTAVTDEQIEVLRNRQVGKEIRNVARQLAKDLNMPEIATVRGLITYVNSVQAPVVQTEDKSEHSASM